MIYIDTEEWLEGRYSGIGGSEAGIVIGCNPWKSRLELWHEKVTKTRHLDPGATITLKIGNMLEPMIAEEYSEATGRQLEMKPQMIHPKYPFIIGNIDREIIDKKGPGVLEIKTKGLWVDWHDIDIPSYYMAQLQHYLAITGYKYGAFAILDLGSRKLKYFDVDRDDKLIDTIITEEKKFWNLVEKKIPPEVNGSDACSKFLKEYYKRSEEITIDISDNKEAAKWMVILKKAKDDKKVAEAQEIESKNHLMSIMGNAEKAVGNFYSITWRSPKDKEVFNIEKFKADNPKLIKEYISFEPQTRRFVVRFS